MISEDEGDDVDNNTEKTPKQTDSRQYIRNRKSMPYDSAASKV